MGQLRRTVFLLVWMALGLLGGLNPVWAEAPATHLVAKTIDGHPISLQEGRGKTSLVVYWSPESLAFRKSVYELQRFVAAPESKDIFLLTISTSADAGAVQTFMADRQLSFPYALRGEDGLGAIDESRLPIVQMFDAEGHLRKQRAGLFNLKIMLNLISAE